MKAAIGLNISLLIWLSLIVCCFTNEYEHHQENAISDEDYTEKRHDHYHHKIDLNKMMQLERRAGHYWQNQMDERTELMNPAFLRMQPTWPCLAGVLPVGGESEAAIKDGHKYMCGLHVIDGPPIIYSYGSHLDDSFERAILDIRPDAKIYIYEIIKDQVILEANRHPDIHYLHLGLGKTGDSGDNSMPTKSMREMMIDNNHTYIDAVKMDIEGFEYEWFQSEGKSIGPRIGQIMIEAHDTTDVRTRYPGQDAFSLLVDMEQHAYLRLFHTEVNVAMPLWGVEFSLINVNWVSWNLISKYSFTRLT